MKNTKVTLVPLTTDDREQFILDNQWAFKYGAIDHLNQVRTFKVRMLRVTPDHIECS